jgi:ABC-2 type transport system permease protein
MSELLLREVRVFFSSLSGILVLSIFLLTMGLFLFVFGETNLLLSPFVTLDSFFDLAPMIFIFLIPAITMKTLAEEKQSGTLELLMTQPIRNSEIAVAKFLASWIIVIIALLPTILYYFTLYFLGDPTGNIDTGGVIGSYIGLILLSGIFCAIGVFASAISENQIMSFIMGTFFSFLIYWGFQYISLLPVFVGKQDDWIQMLGIQYHYVSISRGVLELRDLVYFFSSMALFIGFTVISLDRKK